MTTELMLSGTVIDGAGKVSKILGERLRFRREFCGVELVPGTLNVRPLIGVSNALLRMGPPDKLSSGLEVMSWWRVRLYHGLIPMGRGHDAFVVRGPQSRASYLEIVAEERLRDTGLEAGDEVTLAFVGEADDAER